MNIPAQTPFHRVALALLLSVVPLPAVWAQLTLAEAADSLADKLPQGCIVTAEFNGSHTSYALSGKPDATAADTPPEALLFEIGSISKVFTGILLAQAIHEKKVRLDTTLAELLQNEVSFQDPAIGSITLRQLATHTSGLPRLPSNIGPSPDTQPDPYAAYDRAALYHYLGSATLSGKPPFAASYSNLGFGLLGDLLAKLENTSWEALVKTKITQPLGMTNTSVRLTADQKQRLTPPYKGNQKSNNWHFQALAGAGALRSTAADLITFGRALLDPSGTPFSEAIRLALSPQHPFKDAGAQIGLGIFLGKFMGAPCWDHDGGTGGYRSSIQIQPDTQTVRVILINNAALDPHSLRAAIARPITPIKPAEISLTVEEAKLFTGIYELGPQSRFTVIARDDQLWVRLSGQPFYRVSRSAPNRFFYPSIDAQLEFSPDGDSYSSLTLYQAGRELKFNRTSAPLPALLFRPAVELKKYTGTYQLGKDQKFTITLTDGTLFSQLTGQPALPVFEVREGYFEYDVVTAALEFEANAEGEMVALTLHQNGVHRAPRQPTP